MINLEERLLSCLRGAKIRPKIAYNKKRLQYTTETVNKNAWMVPKAGLEPARP